MVLRDGTAAVGHPTDERAASGTRLSIVCPCFHEEKNVARLLELLQGVLRGIVDSWEIVLVDDGSSDATWDVISAHAVQEPRLRGIRLSRNFGKEAAMLAGLRAAVGEVVIIMDADLQHPPALIPHMLEVMEEEQVDQVIARRDRQGDPWLRTRLSRFYYRFVRSLVDVEFEDGVGDFRAMSRRAVDALLQLTETNRFSKGLMSWIGFPKTFVDYRNVTRTEGATSWSIFSLFNYGIDGVIAFNDRPLRSVIKAGVVAVLLAIGYLVWLFVNWLASGVTAPGYFTTIAAIVLLGGVQLCVLGVMGEYIGRIHSEVKRRPAFLVSDQIASGRSESCRPAIHLREQLETPAGPVPDATRSPVRCDGR